MSRRLVKIEEDITVAKSYQDVAAAGCGRKFG
jgi:hypothetical protein